MASHHKRALICAGTMTIRRLLRLIHLVATVWLVVCIVYLVGLGLRQAGFQETRVRLAE